LSPLVWAISDYATGKYGFLLTTAVIALSAGLASMTVAGFRSRNQSVLTQGELVMLGISSFSMLLSNDCHKHGTHYRKFSLFPADNDHYVEIIHSPAT